MININDFIYITEVFNGLKEYKGICKPFLISNEECFTPFTFLIIYGSDDLNEGYIDFPFINNQSSVCGYSSKEEAEIARQKFVTYLTNKNNSSIDVVYVVTKNTDFVEGTGTKILHKVFRDPKKANNYIMNQNGIYGSKQYKQIITGVNIKGELYGSISYNGYDIEVMEITD